MADQSYAAVIEPTPGYQLDAAPVIAVEVVGAAKCKITFEAADPAKVLGKLDVCLVVEVARPAAEVLTLLNNARFDAWLALGGPEPEELKCE